MNPLPPRTWNPIPARQPKKDKPKSRLARGGSIKPVSAKRAKLNRIYSALRKKFLEEHPYCQWFIFERGVLESDVIRDGGGWINIKDKFLFPVSTDIHHKRGRGKYLLDTSTWMAVSRVGHEKIHADPKTSYEKGYMLPR